MLSPCTIIKKQCYKLTKIRFSIWFLSNFTLISPFNVHFKDNFSGLGMKTESRKVFHPFLYTVKFLWSLNFTIVIIQWCLNELYRYTNGWTELTFNNIRSVIKPKYYSPAQYLYFYPSYNRIAVFLLFSREIKEDYPIYVESSFQIGIFIARKNIKRR